MEENAINYIEREFNRRKMFNKNYSLRSYARNLGVSPGILSQVMNGKRELTPKILKTIGTKINLNEDILTRLIEKQAEIKKTNSIKNVDINKIKNLDMETFSIISDWYHYSILELFNLDSFETNPQWISKKIGITVEEAEQALSNLLKARLLKIDDKGEYYPTNDFTTIDDYQFSSKAMRERQKQILNISSKKIDTCHISTRDHSAITFTIDTDLLPEVKERIRDFRRTLANFIVKNSKKSDAVYELQISTFPVTLSENEEKL